MKTKDIIDTLNKIYSENSNESKRTIWEIFCYQNNVDENSNGREAQVFDAWCVVNF